MNETILPQHICGFHSIMMFPFSCQDRQALNKLLLYGMPRKVLRSLHDFMSSFGHLVDVRSWTPQTSGSSLRFQCSVVENGRQQASNSRLRDINHVWLLSKVIVVLSTLEPHPRKRARRRAERFRWRPPKNNNRSFDLNYWSAISGGCSSVGRAFGWRHRHCFRYRSENAASHLLITSYLRGSASKRCRWEAVSRWDSSVIGSTRSDAHFIFITVSWITNSPPDTKGRLHQHRLS